MRRAWVDAAAVMAAWGVMLLTECVAVLLLWPEQFSASWEYALARRLVLPIAIASLAPVSLVAVGVWEAAVRSTRRAVVGRWILAVAGVGGACAFALGVSNGRHFTNLAVRAPCVLAVTATGGFAVWVLVPVVGRLASRPSALAATGAILAVGAWAADAFLLARLYPAFHDAAFALSLLGGAFVGLSLRPVEPRPRLPALLFAGCVTGIVALCAWWSPRAARELLKASNLRIALVEHAPFLGRAVLVAARLAPPSEETTSSALVTAGQHAEIVRSLDWTGHDLVLLSVDALRADHVSAYGYSRATTPNIYALANEGTAFDSAYCPTPHTSYSLTSMMTGKYLRPLMALGLGEDSETWAQHLRRYGWRTAAFYPPAVFFIDESRFTSFEREHLGFEYAKVEFADPELREKQVVDYLRSAPRSTPLFLWVHFFEPHEPYVPSRRSTSSGSGAEHSSDIDAYMMGRSRPLTTASAASSGSSAPNDLARSSSSRPTTAKSLGSMGAATTARRSTRSRRACLWWCRGRGCRREGASPPSCRRSTSCQRCCRRWEFPRPARACGGRDLGAARCWRATPHPSTTGLRSPKRMTTHSSPSGETGSCASGVWARARYFAPGRTRTSIEISGRALRPGSRSFGPCFEGSNGTTDATRARRGPPGPRPFVAACRATSRRDRRSRRCSMTRTSSSGERRPKFASTCVRHRPFPPSVVRSPTTKTMRYGDGPPWGLTRLSEPIAPLVDALAKGANRDWRRRAALVLAERGGRARVRQEAVIGGGASFLSEQGQRPARRR